ncbi:MAG: ribonuclease P protein component [Granulosicoccus sp.]
MFGFSRKLRLLSKGEYSRVFEKNRRCSDRYWIILVHRSGTDSEPKLGLAIAKKRAKRAVDRNRLKRVAREAFRHHQSQLNGCHLVIMNRDVAAGASANSLRHSLDKLLNTIGEKSK